jgi:hypothetical protein
VYVVGVNGRLCVLMNEMRCFEFWSFHVDIDAIGVYIVASDVHVSSCLGGYSAKLRIHSEGTVVLHVFFCSVMLMYFLFLVFCSGLTAHVLISCSFLVSF